MKIKTWIPQKRKITRTLADVESSAESPVLCWSQCGCFVAPMWQVGRAVWRVDQRDAILQCNGLPEEIELYHQPPQPKTLDEVPDRWIVSDIRKHDGCCRLWCKIQGEWSMCYASEENDSFSPMGCGPTGDWKLTDCEAVAVEVELEVMG